MTINQRATDNDRTEDRPVAGKKETTEVVADAFEVGRTIVEAEISDVSTTDVVDETTEVDTRTESGNGIVVETSTSGAAAFKVAT